MQRDEAKQLLELCRPGNEADRQDPTLREAFALLESDAELREWFETQQAADARISDSLNSLEAPDDLKASILAGMRLHRANTPTEATDSLKSHAGGQRSVVADTAESGNDDAFPSMDTTAQAWWRKPWIGIAALFAVALVILNTPQTNDTGDETALAGLPPVIQFLSSEIDGLKARKFDFDKRDENPEALKAYLAGAQVPSPRSIPDCFAKMKSVGCVTFEYGGTQLSMICFKNGEVYHLITADKATYPDALPIAPEIYQTTDKAFRVWVDGEQVKILTVHGSKEDIPEII